MIRAVLHAYILVFLAVVAGCGQPVVEPAPQGGRLVQRLLVEFNQYTMFNSSVPQFRMKGSDRMVPSGAEVRLTGHVDGRPVDYLATVTAPLDGFARSLGDQGDVLVNLSVQHGLWAEMSPAPVATFVGAVSVELTDEIGTLAEGTLEGMTLTFKADATPTVAPVVSGNFFANETLAVTGENFLRPEEGESFAVVDGTFTYDDPEFPDRAIVGLRAPIQWTGSRTSAQFHIAPNVFGIRPGKFEGSLRFENQLTNGQLFTGNTQPAHILTLGEPFLATVSPPAGSRGQRIHFQGRGFVPQAEDNSYVMFFRFDGMLVLDNGETLDLTGPNALERPADRILSHDTAEMAVWYDIVDGRLLGLGAEPGVFIGSITPVFQDDLGDFEGLPFVGEPAFTVLPTKQIVHLKYLPGFSKGLEKYGLQNVEFEIRSRILEVANRDYAAVNVEFVDVLPTDFLEFATIEIGGPDPTGRGNFGYDNTCNVTEQRCKDTGNLFLGDYLGGINVNSGSEYNAPFGGVFIESFDFFSPTLNPGVEATDPEFDRVLSPFMPALGGTAVRGTEFPGGERDAAIREAIWVVGSVIGNTCTHEIGHSLGLAFFPQDLIRPGEAFHNKIPGDLYIMDAGSDRPFTERAEINLPGVPRFNDRNLEYLLDILPLP